MNVPIWIIVGFQQRDLQNSQSLTNDSTYRPPIKSAQCMIGTKNNPDFAILESYDDDVYSKGLGQIEETFRALTKGDILTQKKSDNNFGSTTHSDVGEDGITVG